MSFRFGTGISSYQVEGDLSHRSRCIWDDFCDINGNIKDHTTGEKAIDFVHRYKEDLKYAKELGIQDFRFSISWPRIISDDDMVNEEGIRFYSSLIDEILRLGMNPVITVFHWDMPSRLMAYGGFISRRILEDFRRYVQVLADNFSSKVKDWITFNEPQCFLGIGYQNSTQAPKGNYSFDEMVFGAHHILLCHSIAYQILKEKNPGCTVSFVNTFNVPLPYKESNPLEEQQRKDILFSTPKTKKDFYTLSVYADPLYLGDYPIAYKRLPSVKKAIQNGDMEMIQKAKPDYLDLNIYTGTYYQKDKNDRIIPIIKDKEEERTALPWLKKRKESIYWGCKFLYGRYHTPIFITENGACYLDEISHGRVHDRKRSEFLREYSEEVKRCIQDGIDIRGYYYWSLFDNFEWEWGESKRFGLIYIDYKDNLKRIKKDSFYTYKEIINKNS